MCECDISSRDFSYYFESSWLDQLNVRYELEKRLRSASKLLVSKKKSQYWSRWKFWSRHWVICMYWGLTEHLQTTISCIHVLYLKILIWSINVDALWCIVPFQRCIQQCINALMHRTRAAPHLKIASQSSSPRCLPLTTNILKTTSRRNQATAILPSPCAHHHWYGGQESSLRLKFCNGPGRPSQDEQTKNLHCNVHPWLFHHHNQNLHNWKHHHSSPNHHWRLSLLVSELGWPMFDDFKIVHCFVIVC